MSTLKELAVPDLDPDPSQKLRLCRRVVMAVPVPKAWALPGKIVLVKVPWQCPELTSSCQSPGKLGKVPVCVCVCARTRVCVRVPYSFLEASSQ